MSIYEYEEFIIGFKQDVPLVFFDENNDPNRNHGKAVTRTCEPRLTLKEVLRASGGVMGESHLGMTEKIVLLKGKICALKRFRKVILKKNEFGRKIEKFARVSRDCKQLVPITAYLYSKRIKFVVCDYYPMGSLADLLAGARNLGQTALEWKQRLKIIVCIAHGIAFIHSQDPPKDQKDIQLNVHGNVKASNVMINIDFTACLSDYGFMQLAERTEFSDTWQKNPPPLDDQYAYCEMLSQKNDVYNFGIILLDILGRKLWMMKLEEMGNGEFEFFVQGKERKQVLNVLNIALKCINNDLEARPTMEQIVIYLGDVLRVKNYSN
ncbi:probable inactive receptor kinase At5g58300 [Solanum lycopersicum]|uniref:probable inactive receptor kinase At5g58300 n=1 Tax=Solanum lycopersicum TaxID=4081 RepID=UPI0008FEBEC0|nr:probable inactive receptor kinase At5g58300 [Solanum lycopersicum]